MICAICKKILRGNPYSIAELFGKENNERDDIVTLGLSGNMHVRFCRKCWEEIIERNAQPDTEDDIEFFESLRSK